jgi:hypothetical protein
MDQKLNVLVIDILLLGAEAADFSPRIMPASGRPLLHG